jgi:hypothetical protein
MSQSQAIQKADKNKILEQVITKGDLAELSPADRVSYYNAVCNSLGLNPLTKPFDFIKLTENGKEVVKLYARKDATEQLRKINGISIWKIENTIEDGCLIVTAYARTPDGREDIDEGIVFIKGKVGDSLANLQMKAITKAKRRVTLSICGLGFLDESEIDSIPGAQQIANPEDDAVMTEAEALSLSHRSSGLDHWKCGRALAMQILNCCADHKLKGMTGETIKSWLPTGVTSRKDLNEGEARYFIANLERRLELFNVCGELAARGVDSETMKSRLPNNIQSLKDLNPAQVEEALKAFTHWLKTYNEVVEGGVVNG